MPRSTHFKKKEGTKTSKNQRRPKQLSQDQIGFFIPPKNEEGKMKPFDKDVKLINKGLWGRKLNQPKMKRPTTIQWSGYCIMLHKIIMTQKDARDAFQRQKINDKTFKFHLEQTNRRNRSLFSDHWAVTNFFPPKTSTMYGIAVLHGKEKSRRINAARASMTPLGLCNLTCKRVNNLKMSRVRLCAIVSPNWQHPWELVQS